MNIKDKKKKTKYKIAISGDMSLWACGFASFFVSVNFCFLFVPNFSTLPFYFVRHRISNHIIQQQKRYILFFQ